MITHIGLSNMKDEKDFYPEHTHAYAEISYIVEGNGYVRAAEKNMPFVPGDIFIIPKECVHTMVSENGHRAISMLSRNALLATIRTPKQLHDNEHRDGFSMAMIMRRYDTNFNECMQKLGEAFIMFILQLLNINSENEYKHIAVNKVIAEMQKRYNDFDIDIKNLLQKSGYSENYIRDTFKEITGTTPTKYLTNIRMENAKAMFLVLKNDHPISDIAQRSGYVDLSYFSKTFKKYTGVSPTEYQRVYGRDKAYIEKYDNISRNEIDLVYGIRMNKKNNK